MSDPGNPAHPEPAITAQARPLAWMRVMPALVVIASSIGTIVFDDVPALRFLFIAVACSALMLMLPKHRQDQWRRHLLDEARFQGDYLWMRRGKDTLVVPLRNIGAVTLRGGFFGLRYLELEMSGPCSMGSLLTLVPKSWPGDSYDRSIVAEQIEERVRRANRSTPRGALAGGSGIREGA